MKNLLAIFTLTVMALTAYSQDVKTIYDFQVEDINGENFDFSSLKGKKIMIVNTASECGLTPQYEQLQAMHEKYGDQLVIVGFPANNFGAQEPGTEEQIVQFCQKNYGVTFLMMSKVSVKGEDQCALYQFLTQKKLNGSQDSEVKWNFQKYLFDESGRLVRVVEPRELPNSEAIVSWVEGN